MGASPGLLERIRERDQLWGAKRAALGEISNQGEPPRTRARLEVGTPTPSREEESGDKVAVQKFTLVSRGAPPAKRAPAQHSVLLAPPRVAAQLGAEVPVCHCSECDKNGVRRRMSGTRKCRRDTEAHPEYALLLLMSDRFETECADRPEASALVTEACCREKTAYFILGAGSQTVGYVAAEVKANRRVKQANASFASDTGGCDADDDVPTIIQVYVEPEFRSRGYAMEALRLCISDRDSFKVDDPSAPMVRILERLGFAGAGTESSDEGRPLTTFFKTRIFEDA